MDRLAALRSQGTLITFDTNYRPSGWENPDDAARVMAKVATVVLATYEDEVAMHNCRSVRDAVTRLADRWCRNPQLRDPLLGDAG